MFLGHFKQKLSVRRFQWILHWISNLHNILFCGLFYRAVSETIYIYICIISPLAHIRISASVLSHLQYPIHQIVIYSHCVTTQRRKFPPPQRATPVPGAGQMRVKLSVFITATTITTKLQGTTHSWAGDGYRICLKVPAFTEPAVHHNSQARRRSI
jgi:hypothetical protein